MREKLGDPIFNRFDGVIRFTDLDSEAKIEIAWKELDELDEEGTISENIRQNLLVNSTRLENAREIRRLIKDTKSLIEIRKSKNITFGDSELEKDYNDYMDTLIENATKNQSSSNSNQ